MDVTQVLTDGNKPITQNGKALTVRAVLTQAIEAHTRQLPAYQAYVTLGKADLLARIQADNELELDQKERALLLEIAGDTISAPAVLAQVYEVLE